MALMNMRACGEPLQLPVGSGPGVVGGVHFRRPPPLRGVVFNPSHHLLCRFRDGRGNEIEQYIW